MVQSIVVYFRNRNIWFVSKDEEVRHDVAEEDPAEKRQVAEYETEDDETSEIPEENLGQ